LDARLCLLGVPVLDSEAITAFERPYREGRYVPPHILADPEAIEASLKSLDMAMECLLSGIASSLKLEVLSFCSECAESVKLVPGRAGNLRSSVNFLHSVVSHQLEYLPGICGLDLFDRLQILEERGTLPESAIYLEAVSPEEDGFINDDASRWYFRLVVENRLPSG